MPSALSRILRFLAPVAALIVVWEALSRSGLVNASLFPPPSAVFAAGVGLARSGELGRDVMASLTRIVVGLGGGVIVGIAVGLLTGRSSLASQLLEPLVQLFRPLPPVALIPLIIVWFGIGEAAKFFSIAFAVFFPVWLNTHLGARQIPRRLLWSASTMTHSSRRIFVEVILPAALPFIVAGVRTGVALAFIMVFVAELAGASTGIGYQISISHLAYRIDKMMAALAVLGALGALTDYVVHTATLRLLPWLALQGTQKATAIASLTGVAREHTQPADASSSIQLEGVSVAYDGRTVLDAVSVDVKRGEFVAIVGLSGSGKTTLLNAVAGFVEATGTVRRPGPIGVVFQDYAAYPWLTARDNIAFGLRDHLSHALDADAARVVDHHLELAGLAGKADAYPAQLSGGQVQRIGVARALAPSPDVILMDEPYGALDRYTREKMQEWLLSVWAQHQHTILFVTHDIEEALYLADRVIVLVDGRIAGELRVPFVRPRLEALKFAREFVELKRDVLVTMRGTRHDTNPALQEIKVEYRVVSHK
jgi:ABC-type nitrate/sulfonate/bicarbonate transport system ATPase subunit/ABC-type nitrate/sulfonate/bicarbonate transport system permease component